MSKEWQIFVAHARECLGRVRDYTRDGRERFLADRMVQDAVLRNLEVLGQCIKDAGVDRLAALAPGTDWRAIADFRNVLAHAYLSVAPDRVWRLIEGELQPLAEVLERLLDDWRP